MKPTKQSGSSPVRHSSMAESAGRAPDTPETMPPSPEPVDPRGPKEYTWPRGWFNFGNMVFFASAVILVVIAIVTYYIQNAV